MPLCLALLLVRPCTEVQAQQSGPGGGVARSGTVVARTLVREPSTDPKKKGAPIFAEFDFTQTDPAKRIVVIGPAKGDLEDARVMSADQYKALIKQAMDFKQANAQGSARGAVFITAKEYETRPLLTPQGDPVNKEPLSPATESVLVRGDETLRTTTTDPVLIASVIDLTKPKELADGIKSVLIDKNGRVVRESRANIGYRTAFYKPTDPSFDFAADATRDEPIGAEPPPGDLALAPVQGAVVWSAYGVGTTNAKGGFTLHYNLPGCPGFTVSYLAPIMAQIPYRRFDPKGKQELGEYPVKLPDSYSCVGTTAFPISTGRFPAEIKIDVAVISGRVVIQGASGPVALSKKNEPTRYDEAGLLTHISLEDLKETDLYVFRESNGQLVTSREGLEENELPTAFTDVGTTEEKAEVFYELLMRGPQDAGSDRVTLGFIEYQAAAQLNEELQSRNADLLRPGERVRVVLINRPTGYIATARTTVRNLSEGIEQGLTPIETLVLEPPNLTVQATRRYQVDAGTAAGEEKQVLIGDEGSGLTSDEVIEITTEWLDQDKTPLPSELEGYTGRLSSLVAAGTLAPVGNDVSNFEIKPGRKIQIARLSEEVTGREHLYLQVNGRPKNRKDKPPDFDTTFDTAAGSNAPEYLRNRPKHFVPVLVPVFLAEKTLEQEIQAAREAAESYSGGDAPVLDNPEPLYDYQRRADYHFTLFDLKINEIAVVTEEGATRVEVDYDLLGPGDRALIEPLPRFGGNQRALEFLLNNQGVLAAISALSEDEQLAVLAELEKLLAETPAGAQLIVKSTPNSDPQLAGGEGLLAEILARLRPEDYLTLSLVHSGDQPNALFEVSGLPLLIVPRFLARDMGRLEPLELERTVHIAAYDPGIAGNAGEDEVTDTFEKIDFVATQEVDLSVKLLGSDRSELREVVAKDGLPPGVWSFVLTPTDLSDAGISASTPFYLEIRAESRSDAAPIVQRSVHPGSLRTSSNSRMLGNVLQHDVLIQSGALSLRREDLKLKGRGTELTFLRSYTNQAEATQSSVLGEGWSHNHDIRLFVQGYGTQPTPNNLPAWVAERRGELFRPSEVRASSDQKLARLVTVTNGGQFKRVNGIFYPQRSHHGTLRETASGYEYRSKDGTLYFFRRPVLPADPDPSEGVDRPRFVSLGDSLYARLGIPLAALELFPLPAASEQGSPRAGHEPVQYIEDRNGNRMTYVYGGGTDGPVVTRVTDAVGRQLSFEYSGIQHTQLNRVVGPDGIVLEFLYDQANTGPLLREFRRDAFKETYGYASQSLRLAHNLVTATDANLHVTRYSYLPASSVTPAMQAALKVDDREDIVSSITYAAGTPVEATARFAYLTDGTNNRVVTDPRNNPTTYQLNAFGNPLEVREPLGKTTRMTWSIDQGLPDNVMTTQSMPHVGLTTTYTYDSKGNPTSESDNQTGSTQTMSWRQDFSLLEERIDKNGVRMTMRYDARGNLTEERLFGADVGGAPTTVTRTHEYAPNGDRIRTIDYRGHATTFAYDAFGNLRQVVEPEGSTRVLENDVRGRMTREVDPNENIRTYAYDTLDRRTRETDAKGNTREHVYDPKGNKIREVWAETYAAGGDSVQTSLTLTETYDARDRVISIVRSGSGPGRTIRGTQTFGYDLNSNVVRETHWLNSLATQHEYDALNRRVATVNRANDRSTVVYGFQPGVGTEMRETDEEGRITVRLVDRLGRLVRVTRPPVVQLDTTGSPLPPVTHTRTYVYDALDHVRFETDEEQRTWEKVYDARYNVIRRIDPLQPVRGVHRWEFDENGNLAREIDEEERSTSYQYDRQNRRTRMSQPEGHFTTYEYDANGNTTRWIDSYGFSFSATFDALDHPETQTDPDGTIELDHTARGKVTFTRNAEGQEARTLYDVLERAVEERDPRGRMTYHSYDENDNEVVKLRTWPGHSGGATSVRDEKSYDVLDRLELEIQARGALNPNTQLAIEYEYDKVGNVVRMEHPDGRIVQTLHDAFNRAIRVTDALGRSTILRYDGVGNLRYTTNRRGHTSEILYDELNRKTEDRWPTLAASGLTIAKTYRYDAVGNLIRESNRRQPGVAAADTVHSYDGLNRLLSSEKRAVISDPPIRLIRNEYDTSGLRNGTRQSATSDANQNRVVSDWNFRGQMTARRYPQGELETLRYDRVGNVTEAVDAEGFATRSTYHPDNVLSSSTNPEGETTRYEYDILGKKIREIRPKGVDFTTTWLHDERGRLIRVIDPSGGVTRYEYDVNGNLLRQFMPPANDAGIESRVEYVYDVLNRRTQHIQHKASGSLVTVMDYDAEGNETLRIDAKGQQFSYEYDELQRRVLERYPTTAPTPYLTLGAVATVFDDNNNPTQVVESKTGAVDGSGGGGTAVDLCVMEYDLFDRLVRRTQRGHVVEYAYDDNGNRTRVASLGGETIYTFDHRNRVSTARLDAGDLTNYSYLRNNWLERVRYPNATEVFTTYDRVGRPTAVLNRRSNGTLLSSFGYVYDDNGNRTEQLGIQAGFAADQEERTRYAFDRNDRLSQVEVERLETGRIVRTDYTYYASYDRRSETRTELGASSGAVESRVYTYDETHWLTRVAHAPSGQATDYAYDNNGNALSKADRRFSPPEVSQFVYDSQNRLVQSSRGPPSAQVVQGRYDYDYLGMRIRHLASDRGDLEYIYDGRAILDERRPSGGMLVAHYNYVERLLSLKTPADIQFYHYQALDTTANLSDSTGALRISYRTDVWGQITEQQGNSVNRQVFTGQEHDENTGLIYFGARYYDPDAARFINQDAYLGEPGTPPSLHRYLYAYSNPTVYVDLHGYSACYSDGSDPSFCETPEDQAREEAERKKALDDTIQKRQEQAELRLKKYLEDLHNRGPGDSGQEEKEDWALTAELKEIIDSATNFALQDSDPNDIDYGTYDPEQGFYDLLKRGNRTIFETTTGVDTETLKEFNEAVQAGDTETAALKAAQLGWWSAASAALKMRPAAMKRVWRQLRGYSGTRSGLRSVDDNIRRKLSKNAETRKQLQSLELEDESADILVRDGYDVKQNPKGRTSKGTNPGESLPDFEIENEYWEQYSPDTAKLKGIRAEMLGKANNQSPRLVINLSRSKNVNVGEFIDNMRQKPIPGVKKIIVITPWGQALRL